MQNFGEQIQVKGSKSVSTVFLGPLTNFRCSFTEMKSTFIKLQNEPLPKDISQVLLIVRDGPLFLLGGGYLFLKKNCSQAVVG